MTPIAAAWAAVRTPAVQLVATAIVLLASLWFAEARGYARGVTTERSRWEARLAADETRARETSARQTAAGAAVGARVVERQAQARMVTENLVREIPIYVTAEADAHCDVPVGLVRLHDAAAAGLPAAADAAGRPADAASGLALSAVAETVTDNYGACRANAEALKGWQAWWAAVSASSMAARAEEDELTLWSSR